LEGSFGAATLVGRLPEASMPTAHAAPHHVDLHHF
jgi:hypothetical protein